MKVQIELDDLSRKTLVRIALETSDSDVLEELAKSNSSKVLTAVASNGWTKVETIKRLANHSNKEVKTAALKTLNC